MPKARPYICRWQLSCDIGVVEPELSYLREMSVPAINVFYPRFPIAKEVLDKLNKSEKGLI